MKLLDIYRAWYIFMCVGAFMALIGYNYIFIYYAGAIIATIGLILFFGYSKSEEFSRYYL